MECEISKHSVSPLRFLNGSRLHPSARLDEQYLDEESIVAHRTVAIAKNPLAHAHEEDAEDGS
jgi:hypothetical protein